jgi:hypothetical protein
MCIPGHYTLAIKVSRDFKKMEIEASRLRGGTTQSCTGMLELETLGQQGLLDDAYHTAPGPPEQVAIGEALL